jgi:flagellar export protein FliJ
MGKKFEFRLEKILSLRAQKVTQEKLALGKVQSLRLNKEQEAQSQNDYQDELKKVKHNKGQASMLQAHHQHRTFIQEEIKKLEEEIDQLKEIEELRRVRLTEAMKDEKVLEKLKEKRKFDHEEDSKHEEVLTLDEISQMRFEKRKVTQ